MRSVIRFALVFIFLAAGHFASANDPQTQIITQIENYLNSFKNFAAEFEQNDIDHVCRGTLKISKPGKFRWEYDDGKLLIISTGDTIIYVDNELDNVHYIASDDTIAKFLSQEKISFLNDEYAVEKVVAHDGEVMLMIKSNKENELGKINLGFSIKPISLKTIEVIDANDNLVHLNIKNITYPEKFDSELFNYYENHNRSR
jgi:outer membrane lipoprotein-sorting protein